MKKQFLFILFILFAFGVTLAQDKQKASPTPIPAKPEISLALTPAEAEAGSKIQASINELGKALNAALIKQVAARNDKDMLAAAYETAKYMGDMLNAQKEQSAWFTDAQRSHGCQECSLDTKSWTFVKPVEPKK